MRNSTGLIVLFGALGALGACGPGGPGDSAGESDLILPLGLADLAPDSRLTGAVAQWAESAPTVVDAEVVQVQTSRDGADRFTSEVTLQVVRVLRSDTELEPGQLLPLVTPGGTIGDVMQISSAAPLFVEDSRAILALGQEEGEWTTPLGNRGAIGLQGDTLAACVDPDEEAAHDCALAGLPIVFWDPAHPLPIAESVQGLDVTYLHSL